MVGVLFGFTALDAGRPYHYSHVTGVARQYQSRGVGFRLKLAQRRHVLRQSQELVKWTYDPLQASNAYFNIGKLGAVCRVYKRNLYGRLEDSLNRGRITDRFEVEWWLKSRRVLARVRGVWRPMTLDRAHSKGARLLNNTERVGPRVRRPMGAHLGLRHGLLLFEIPENIVKAANSSLRLANQWTLHARRVLETYFRRGYAVTDIVLDESKTERRLFYLLEKNFEL
jgi:predicted GNAT superfamily acetyltransferase